MTTHPFSCIVFDLDGTLVDTAPDLTGALNHVLSLNGLDPFTVEHVRNIVGFGARITLERSFAQYGISIETDALDEAHAQFLAHYTNNICLSSELFPGVTGVLEEFRTAGIKMVVCTNKTEHLSVDLLEQIGIAHYFEAICGSDTVANKKPHPDHIAVAIERAGGQSDAAIMIGDSHVDVNSAKAAGIPVIAMSYGYTATPPHELGADLVLDEFKDIPQALQHFA